MPTDLSEILVIGVSTRALFDLEKENEVFEKEGIDGFRNINRSMKRLLFFMEQPLRWCRVCFSSISGYNLDRSEKWRGVCAFVDAV